MRKTLILAGLFATAPLIAQSTPQIPGAADPSRITGGTYATDPSHTLIEFEVDHFGFSDYFGIFGDATGTLILDPKKPADAKVDITIPVAKVITASARLTEHLLRAGKDGGKPDFFGPNPADARFVSTKVVVKGTTAKITGNLTLNGVTAPVVLDAEFKGAGINPYSKKETVGFEAETVIKRSTFGIKTGIPFVSDEVELEISVPFEKAG